MIRESNFDFYQSGDLSHYLSDRDNRIKEKIRQEDENYILNVNEEDYKNYLLHEYTLNEIVLHKEKMYYDTKEEMIPAEKFPSDFYVIHGKSYPRMVIYLHIPITGDIKLLKYRPSIFSLPVPQVYIVNNEVVFNIVQFKNDKEHIEREINYKLNELGKIIRSMNSDIRDYNNSLGKKINTFFNSRKQELLERRNLLSELNIPMKKRENVAETFSIPSPKLKKKITVKPKASTKNFEPEPTLEENIYYEILNRINDMGKEFERKPSVYINKEEENLRDHFLMILEPHFEGGSATGETFNKSGKTDILLRHDGNNVFIAECKFWNGEKGLNETINQLLGYLTWRDSKAAVIFFVTRKNFTNIIEKARKEICNHDNYLGYINQKDETWFNYRFHIKGDSSREVKLALMLYHLYKE